MALYERAPKSRPITRRSLSLFADLASRGSDWLRVRRYGRRRSQPVLITSVYSMPETVKGQVDVIH